MNGRTAVVAVAVAGLAVAAGGRVARQPYEVRVGAIEDRVAGLEKRLDDLQAQLAALQTRVEAGAPTAGRAGIGTAEWGVDVRAAVRQVIDGSTIRLASGETVRLIGVDTAQADRQAAAYVRALVEGKTARLDFDVQRRDAHNRLLAYVYMGSRFVNAELIRHGLAKAVTAPPNVRHAAAFLKLQREARAAHRGLWAERPKP